MAEGTTFNIFKAFLGVTVTIFPALGFFTWAAEHVAGLVNETLFQENTSVFVDVFNSINYFIPLELIFAIVAFHFFFMAALLVFKWILKFIPFIG